MLLADLDLNAAPAVNALNRVNSAFNATTSGMAAMASRLGPIVAGFVTFSTVLNGLRSAMDLGGTLDDAAARTGETAGEMMILRQAFEAAGIGADGAEGAVLRLQDAIAGVNADSKSTAAALAALGTSADELRTLSATEQFARLSRGFEQLEQTAKVATARDLFGKSGGEMLSLLGDPAAMENAARVAGPLAAAMDKNAAAFARLGDNIDVLKLKSTEFFTGALSQIAPEATSIADAFERIDFVEIGEGFGTVAGAVLKLAEGLAAVNDAFDKTLDFFLGAKTPALSEFDEAGVNRRRGLTPRRGSAFGDFGETALSPVGSLQRIGLGGGFGGGDPLLTENQRQTRLLERIAERVGPAGRPADEPFSRPVPI